MSDVSVSIAACLLFVIILGGSLDVLAHPGGINRQGCHNDNEKGECHCHRDKQGKKIESASYLPK